MLASVSRKETFKSPPANQILDLNPTKRKGTAEIFIFDVKIFIFDVNGVIYL